MAYPSRFRWLLVVAALLRLLQGLAPAALTMVPAGKEAGRVLSLSGDDWWIASFEPGQGVGQRAFAEGFPMAQALPAIVPGDIHWDLERAGRIPPIYYGTNSAQVGWVAAREWWCQKRFLAPAGWRGKQIWLQFDAVDYLADVWLNGHSLGRHEGQFTPFDFNVADCLLPGQTNTLTVLIHPAPASVRAAIASGAGEWAVMTAMRKAYPRWKCQTNAGWDWGAKIVTMGIWQDVRLIAADGVRLSRLTVQPRLSSPFTNAVLHVELNARSARAERLELTFVAQCLTVSDPPVMLTKTVDLPASGSRFSLEMAVPHPRLWWPNGYGAQHLYELRVAAGHIGSITSLDRLNTTFGIRDLQMIPNPFAEDNLAYVDYTTDSPITHELPQPPPERRYLIQINGRRIFARGGNWIPCDLLYGRPRQSAYEHLIALAGQANFNLFRVWGGGLIEKPVFYDLCDRFGIMLFQEFPNAGARLAETEEALAVAAEETRQVLPLLINHPSVVRYGGANEWYRNASNSRQMAQFRRICGEMDPTRPFHDPDPECIAQRHGPHSYEWSQHYRTYNTGHPLTAGPDNPLEWTEYGASGVASVETLRRVLPAKSLWPIRSSDPHWIWHKAFGAFGVDNWMGSAQYFHLFGDLPDLETTVRASQFVQAEGLRYANQSMRRRQWHRSACASWTFNEPWPNAAHGCLVEYYGAPKMAYYYTRNAYAPVDVSAEYSSLVCHPETVFPLKLFAVHDGTSPLRRCQLTALAMDIRGRQYGRQSWQCDLAPEAASNVGTFNLRMPKEAAGTVVLVQLQLRDADGRDLSTETYTFGVVGENKAEASAECMVPAVSPDGRRNLALLPAAKATASSVLSGYAIHQVAHLNNGWYGNEASWIAGENPAWAQIDLGSVYTISRVNVGNDHTLKFTDRGIRNLRIIVSADRPNDRNEPAWHTVATYKGDPIQCGKTFDFEPLRARLVRLAIADSPGARIDEIEIWEAELLAVDKIAAARATAVRGPRPARPDEAWPRGALKAMLSAPSTQLKLSFGSGLRNARSTAASANHRATVRNLGDVPALFVTLDLALTDGQRHHARDSAFTLLPGDSREVDVMAFLNSLPQKDLMSFNLRARAWNAPDVSCSLLVSNSEPQTDAVNSRR